MIRLVLHALLACLLWSCTQVSAATFTVASTADTGGSCSATPDNCTLRQAIATANAAPLADTIAFNIRTTPPHVIAPATPLPPITGTLTIDGYSQDGAAVNSSATGFNASIRIELSGANIPTSYGLLVQSTSQVVIRGLAISGFSGLSGGVAGRAIEVDGSGPVDVRGCAIGLTQAFALAGNRHGILVGSGQTGAVTIGTQGSTASALANRNLIAGNVANGVLVLGGIGQVDVLNNLVGTAPAGNTHLGATNNGINVLRSGARIRDNVIKGSDVGIVLQAGGFDVTGNIVGRASSDLAGTLANRIGVRIQGTFFGAGRIGGNGSFANQLLRNDEHAVEHAAANLDVNFAKNRFIGGSPNGLFAYELLGIDGRDPNDAGDPDSGPNGLQNAPVIATATRHSNDPGAPITVTGTLNALPDRSFLVVFMDSLGALSDVTASVQTDANGNGAFGPLEVVFPATSVVSMTATATLFDSLTGLLRATSEQSISINPVLVAPPTAFVVNSVVDPGDGSCNAAQCTLREAIAAANGNANPLSVDAIHFAIPGGAGAVHSIQLSAPLPQITEPVLIDGYTQAGAVANSDASGVGSNAQLKIEIVGGAFHFNDVNSSALGVTLRGLSIVGFLPPPVAGGLALSGINSRIEGCWFGVRPNGSELLGNIAVAIDGDGGVFGGDAPAQRNVWVNQRALSLNRGRAVNNLFGVLPNGRTAATVSLFQPLSGAALRATSGQPVLIERNVFSTPSGIAALIVREAQVLDNAFGEAWDGASTFSLGSALRPGVNTRMASSTHAIRGALNDAVVIDSAAQSGPIVLEQPIVGGAGKGVVHAFSTEVSIRAPISGTAGIGIDLVGGLGELPSGVTPNDVNAQVGIDADIGPNGLQNFPELVAADRQGNSLTVTGTLRSLPNQSFRILICGMASAHASGHGGCDAVLDDQTVVSTNADGFAEFAIATSAGPDHAFVSATAARIVEAGLREQTSEFAAAIAIAQVGDAIHANGFE